MVFPTDSAEARELREAEQSRAEQQLEDDRRHDDQCRGGWLGLDLEERPIPCPRCRPHLLVVACRLCGAPAQACRSLMAIRRGPCCEQCDHRPSTREQVTTR